MESQIKTVADAFAYTNRDITVLQNLQGLPEQDVEYMTASYKRMVVTEALNKEANGGIDWKPDYENGSRKYEPWVWLKNNPDPAGVGFVVHATCYDNTLTYTTCGSRLCFKSEELVEYFNEQFADLLQITMAE